MSPASTNLELYPKRVFRCPFTDSAHAVSAEWFGLACRTEYEAQRVLPLLSPPVLTPEVAGMLASVDRSYRNCCSMASLFRAVWAPRATSPAGDGSVPWTVDEWGGNDFESESYCHR